MKDVLGFVGPQIFTACGLVAHSQDDVRRLMAGKEVGCAFGMGTDYFTLGGSTTHEDLVTELELMRAQITSPGWRDE